MVNSYIVNRSRDLNKGELRFFVIEVKQEFVWILNELVFIV